MLIKVYNYHSTQQLIVNYALRAAYNVGKERRFITKVFNNTNVKVAFITENTIERLLSTQHKQVQIKYEKCGIYQLTCPTCKMQYTGQTARPFKIGFQEYLRDFKYGKNKLKIAQYLLEDRHQIGPMENIMENIHLTL